MATSNWKKMYQTQYRKFKSTLSTAMERGYSIRPEVLGITEAKGGYKSAYERLKQYDLNYFKRASRAIELEEERKAEQQLERTRREIQREMESLYRDTYNSITGSFPEEMPEITYDTTADDVMGMIDRVADSTLSSEASNEDIVQQAYDLINDIQAFRELKYRAKNALDKALTKNHEQTVEALQRQASDVVSTLQKGKDLWYNGLSVEKDEEASIWLSEWLGILENVD